MEGPLVGVGVFVKRNGKILVGLRKSALGRGTWALPGGRLEPGETPAQCGVREVLEETGLQVGPLRPLVFAHTVFRRPDIHYITLLFSGDSGEGPPQLLEPEKCEEWRWVNADEVPEPVFAPLSEALEEIRRRGMRL